MSSTRQLDIVVLGATGYTGKLCAEHIAKNHPTNLGWAIAGRSADKLNALADELQKLASDRREPEVLPVQMNDEELGDLARKTTVLINCIGPYHIYSSPVVAACAENGTHYLDMTGEIPWIKKMIEKHHEAAKAKGTILMSAVGMESVPVDLLSWAMANMLKEKYGVRTKEAVISGYELKVAGLSGGTLASALNLSKNTPASEMAASGNPHYLEASRQTFPSQEKPTPLSHKLFGVRNIPHIGTVTTALGSYIDVPVVQRGASLMPDLYDPSFRFREYMNVSSTLVGIATHFALVAMAFVLVIPPLRWLASTVGPAQGTGPSDEKKEGNRIEFRGIAMGEKDDGSEVLSMGRFVYEGCPYTLTGVVATEAAMVLLHNEELVRELGGGYLTPGMLRQDFMDRLQKVGVGMEAKILEE